MHIFSTMAKICIMQPYSINVHRQQISMLVLKVEQFQLTKVICSIIYSNFHDITQTTHVCVEPCISAFNMTLPAAEAWARAADIDQHLLFMPELSSKPAARHRCCRSTGQTDGWTNGR